MLSFIIELLNHIFQLPDHNNFIQVVVLLLISIRFVTLTGLCPKSHIDFITKNQISSCPPKNE